MKRLIVSLSRKMLLLSGIFLGGTLLTASAAPRSGDAVLAVHTGDVKARVHTGPVHYGKSKVLVLADGQAVGEGSRLMTGEDGHACMVLSPGAILCIAPETEITFRQLRHAADGLPEREEDLIRRIDLDLRKGRVLLHASAPLATLDIRVKTSEGVVTAHGGTFIVSEHDQGEWIIVSEEYTQHVTPENGSQIELQAGEAVRMTRAGDEVSVEADVEDLEASVRKFAACRTFFGDLDPFVANPLRFDRDGLVAYLGAVGGIDFVGLTDRVRDVSPSIRRPLTSEARKAPRAGERTKAGRWGKKRVWLWYEQIGVLKGVNYIPRHAVNSTEMWQAETFDKEVIDEELRWAREAGYTAIRVQLQYVVWQSGPDEFFDRVDRLLDLARKHELWVVPVLFDDQNVANRGPTAGPQPEPAPGVHNSQWTPSPGSSKVVDREEWPNLKAYVQGVVGEFEDDDRVAYWDLYNRTGDDESWEKSLPLMDQTFVWTREVDPDQPLAVAAWTRYGSAMSARMLERSDIITFQSFEDGDYVEALIQMLNKYDRPVICSDWLLRTQGSTFEELLPVFSAHRVGWFNRGLVHGKTQQWIQQAAFRSDADPDIWQHDVLKEDGRPYDEKEAELIKSFRFSKENL